MKCLGIKTNDLVIAPSYTFIATINSIIHSGARPWLFDTKKNELTINLMQIEKALKQNSFKQGKYYYHKKTKQRIFAICPVYTLGHLPDLNKIKKLAKKYNLKIIADAACALGVKYKSQKITKFNDAVCYSFNGNKSITAGGGGAVSLNNKVIYKKIFLMSTNAKINTYDHVFPGHNYRITGLHAAIGLGQLINIKKIQNFKNIISNKYSIFFKKNNLKTIVNKFGNSRIQWLNFILCKKDIRKSMVLSAKKSRINLNYFWKPMHLQPFLKSSLKENMVNTNKMWKKILVLPSSINLSNNEINKVKKFLVKNIINF